MDYDYVIVGGGSAGCVAANRLVRDHGARVLLLEAGPKDNSPLIKMPAGTFKMMFSQSPFIKRHVSPPQRGLEGRTVSIAQGNVIGGGSSVNVMFYLRGTREDYDDWEASAGGGWGWNDLVPYFRRQEGNVRLEGSAHGRDGPLKVSDPLHVMKAARHFIETMQRRGLTLRDDFSGGELAGVGYVQSTIGGARRCSAADAFLRPIERDPRLTILTGATVHRVLLENRRAVGVEYRHNGKVKTARAAREVILAAGAYISPKLLMLSGIGPAEHLRSHGIRVEIDLPGVGQNLMDHNEVFLTAATRGAFGYAGEDRGWRMLRNALRYLLFRSGPVASNGAETTAFLNMADASGRPDIQLYFLGVQWPFDGVPVRDDGVTLIANLVRPLSRGSVTLRSADPTDDPVVDPNWLSHPHDVERLLAALRYLREVLGTKPLAGLIEAERFPGPALTKDAELVDYMRRTTESNYHPCGTCRMGRDDDPMAVLRNDLSVRGVTALRVVDASMMPTIISANTNATVMAVADRAIDVMMAGSHLHR